MDSDILLAGAVNTTSPQSPGSSANDAADWGEFFPPTNGNGAGKQLEHVVTLVVGVKIEMREN